MAQAPRLTYDELRALMNEADDLREVAGKKARARQIEIAQILKSRKWPYRREMWHYHEHQTAAMIVACCEAEGWFNPMELPTLDQISKLSSEAADLRYTPGEAARERQREIAEQLAAWVGLVDGLVLDDARQTIAMCHSLCDGGWFEEPQLAPEPATLPAELDDEIPF